MAKVTPIQQGERFTRPEAPSVVWVIEKLVSYPGLPTHARLVAENRNQKMMTISETALRDQKFYTPLENENSLSKPVTERSGLMAPARKDKVTRRLFGIDFDVLPNIGPLLSR